MIFTISSKYDTFENVGMLVEHDFEFVYIPPKMTRYTHGIT